MSCKTGKIALIFDGQAGLSQKRAQRAILCPLVKERLEQGSEILGRSLLAFPNSETQVLNDPALSQSFQFTVEVGLNDELEVRGIRPLVVTGGSLGLWAAAVAAGVLTFEAALPMVEERGKLIARVTQEFDGVTVNVRSNDPLVSRVTRFLGEETAIAVVNSLHNINVTGPRKKMMELLEHLRSDGLEVETLPIPLSHSPLLRDRLTGFVRRQLGKGRVFQRPLIPIINDTTGTLIVRFGGVLRNHFKTQLTEAVQIPLITDRLRQLQASRILNLGINPYLWRWVEQNWPGREVFRVYDLESLNEVERILTGE